MNARDTMPAARILHVDDQPESHEWLKLALERKQYEVTVATDGQSALASFTTHRPDVVLLDHELPDQSGLEVLRHLKNADPLVEVVMLTGHGSVSLAVEAMREGAFNFVEKPVEFAVLEAVLDKALAHRNLHAEAARLRMSHERRDGLGRLVGTSPAMRRLFDLITLVAPTDASVLIRGENGTGKELVADAVHERSPRTNGPIIKINCGAIPGELFESELFGHKRGAFTGALADKRGLIESADRGTLLLDEIGEMPANAQVKLLRVLQEKQVRRLGETRMSTPDFRLICATNARLETLMAENRFREDLFFRINTVVLDIPPLRERREDIPVLAQLFLQRYCGEVRARGRPLSPVGAAAAPQARLAWQRPRARTRRRACRHRRHRTRGPAASPAGNIPLRLDGRRHQPALHARRRRARGHRPDTGLHAGQQARRRGHPRGLSSDPLRQDAQVRLDGAAGRSGDGMSVSDHPVSTGRAAATLDRVTALVRLSVAGGGVIFVNQAWCDVTGTTLEANLGEGWLKSVHEADRARVLLSLAMAPQTQSLDYRLQTRDGRIRRRQRVDHGRPGREAAGAGDVVHTVTTREDAAPGGQTMSKWAHELRGPLNAILGWSDLLGSGDSDPDVVQRGFKAIANNARQQAAIIKRMAE